MELAKDGPGGVDQAPLASYADHRRRGRQPDAEGLRNRSAARSSISSRVWGPLIRARRMLAASPSSRSGRAGSLESTATSLSQPEAIAAWIGSSLAG